jgi:hypothetical protein
MPAHPLRIPRAAIYRVPGRVIALPERVNVTDAGSCRRAAAIVILALVSIVELRSGGCRASAWLGVRRSDRDRCRSVTSERLSEMLAAAL